MTLVSELAVNKARLYVASRTLEPFQPHQDTSRYLPPSETSYPRGFFGPVREKQFLRADEIIERTVNSAMAELGVDEYQLRREFANIERGVRKLFTLFMGENTVDYVLNQSKSPNQPQVRLTYQPASVWHYGETLTLEDASIPVPCFEVENANLGYRGGLSLEEALGYIQGADNTHLARFPVIASPVNTQNIRGLLVLALANPQPQTAISLAV